MADDRRLDGNAAAGLLGPIFVAEMSTAHIVCAHCGQEGVIGEAAVYVSAMGLIARCGSCGEPLLRVAPGPQSVLVDFSGTRLLRLPLTE